MTEQAAPRELLESLLGVLLRQEEALGGLVRLAFLERDALVRADTEAITRLSAEMIDVAHAIDALDTERKAIVHQLGAGLALEALLPLADDLDVPGLKATRERLLAQAAALREAQETNARLILSAVKLRERWYGMLAGLAAPTYGASGRQEVRQGRDLVSKSA